MSIDPKKLAALPAEQQELVLKELKKRKIKDSLYYFCKNVLKFELVAEKPHKEMCEFIEKWEKNKEKMILVPRGCLKSTICTKAYALQQLCINPNIRILIVSNTYAKACTFLEHMKLIMRQNTELISLYGEFYDPNKIWREDRVFIKQRTATSIQEPTLMAIGVGGSIPGYHFDLLICDDLHDENNANSQEQIRGVIQYYINLFPVIENGNSIIIGTRWSYADLYCKIAEDYNHIHEWKKLVEDPKFIFHGPQTDIMVRKAYYGTFGEGELYFPDKIDWKFLTRVKDRSLDEYADLSIPGLLAAQYLNDPDESGLTKFKIDWLKEYGSEQEPLPVGPSDTYITIDPAVGESSRSDYTAIIVNQVFRSKPSHWYIREVVREHLNPRELVDRLILLKSKWRPYKVGIETVAFQKTLRFYLKEELHRRNVSLRVDEIKVSTHKSKEQRIDALIPKMERGEILIEPGMVDLRDEVKRYPSPASHDDILDALAHQLELVKPRNGLLQLPERGLLYGLGTSSKNEEY